MPRLYPTEEAYERTAGLRSEPYFCIAPTSVWATKEWPKEKWEELIEQLPRHKRIILIGGPDDRDSCEWISRSCERADIKIAAGSYGLMDSLALIDGADRLFANDSAPVHMASALGTPTTAVFCSTLPSFGFGPLAEGSVSVEREGELYCRPCGMHGKNACPEGHFKCAWEIEPKQLLNSIPS
jgi:heptosyltransferase-2